MESTAIRDGPGEDYDETDSVSSDEGWLVEGPVWEDGGVWWQVELDDHANGWIKQSSLEKI